MYKILKPIVGYGYTVGTQTDKIKAKDAEVFLEARLIEKVEAKAPAPKAPTKEKKK